MRLIFSLLIMLECLTVLSQNTQGKADDAGRIVLNTFVPDQIEGLTPAVKRNLENKLSQIATLGGMGGVALDPRFIITSNVVVLTKDITPTAPPMLSYTLEITLYIGDGIDGNLFSTTSLTVKGVGQTETRAYTAALNNLRPNNPVFKEFLLIGKNKIIEYYNSRCDFILKEAEALAQRQEFDEAIAQLVSIPEVTKECYEKAMEKSGIVYKQKLELECQQNISKANAAIAQDKWHEAADYLSMITPDLDCYNQASHIIKKIQNHQCAIDLGKARAAWAARNSEEAAKYLGNISSDSKCMAEANLLIREISSRLDQRQKREWDLAYEKYNRNQIIKERRLDSDIALDNRNMDYKENQGFELEKARIESARQVGVAYGKNQPKKITYNLRGWW